jgi:SAM-dependent methyltransferase
MARPTTTVVQMPWQNPHASAPLILPVLVVCNTSDAELERNIAANAALPLPWVGFQPAHGKVAVMVGGGPSMADHLYDIHDWQMQGATVFAMNAASMFLREAGIAVDYQVLADAKPETAELVDPWAKHHLVASQVDAATMARAERTTLWHLCIDETMDRLFPVERRKAGGYALIGGGAAVGNSAMCLAYVMGYRRFEVYGYDSSHRGDASHAYDQPMNRFIPVAEVQWAGKTYRASVAMKAQAEKFQITGQALKNEGCAIHVHGNGLLPAMWNTRAEDLEECDKYRRMWSTDSYRNVSPGEEIVPLILDKLRPAGLVLDFGCGTGRASLALARAGLDVLLIDFADNCRDEEAMGLPFLEWDLTRPLPPHAHYGICTDVMEHLPPESVDVALANIMAAADRVFFQISTTEDDMGVLIDQTLHLTVRPHAWWRERLAALGAIEWEDDQTVASLFIVRSHACQSH